MKVLRLRVQAGKASPAPPLGPTLAQYGLPVNKVVEEVNEATKEYAGLEVTLILRIDEATGKYSIEVKSPTTTSLLLRYAGVQEPSGDPAHKKIGNISIEDAVRVAIAKRRDLNARTLKAAVKSVVSTARSVGLTVEGKDPREVLREIDSGVYDEVFKKYEELWSGGRGATD
jgi:large subunit ribosomal protein L11